MSWPPRRYCLLSALRPSSMRRVLTSKGTLVLDPEARDGPEEKGVRRFVSCERLEPLAAVGDVVVHVVVLAPT